MATLELRDIGKRFGGRTWAARDVRLEVKDREFVVLLGPSGCGKTTTLRLIAGLEEATSGSVLLDGKDITFLPPRKRNVSMVFQNYAVWPHMTVFENIAFPLRLRKVADTEVRETVNEVARLTKINDYLERHPSQLSGGQQQRVALARALAVKPKLFLMDEPFSNLDAALRVAMRTELRAIHQQAEATTIFVTHDQAEAMSLADRVVVMKDGRIVQDGTPEDVYFKCADTFVAGFIGTPPMNFFDTTAALREGRALFSHDAFTLTLPAERMRQLGDEPRAVTVGVRPEDMMLLPREDALFAGQAMVVEPQGSHQVVSMRLGGRILKLVAPPAPKLRPGDPIQVGFDCQKLHFFDGGTGARLG
ncbi:ABC transporter ATP-binding protein [Verrucomicrobiota bacterium]